MRCYKCGSFLTDGDTCPQCGEYVGIYKKTARVSDDKRASHGQCDFHSVSG